MSSHGFYNPDQVRQEEDRRRFREFWSRACGSEPKQQVQAGGAPSSAEREELEKAEEAAATYFIYRKGCAPTVLKGPDIR